MTCQIDSDCPYLRICNAQNECVHEPLWPPGVLDVIAMILIPFVIGLGNVGGSGNLIFLKNIEFYYINIKNLHLGGGITKVPIMMMMMNYD